jgi:hypothetical protein
MTGSNVTLLVRDIRDALASLSPGDAIHTCGSAPLRVIQQHPEDVLALAHQKLHAWKFEHVSLAWRRLYEEASLWQTVQTLNNHSPRGLKRKRDSTLLLEDDCISSVVHVLDMAMILTGAPLRRQLILSIFDSLSSFLDPEEDNQMPTSFPLTSIKHVQDDSFIRVERLDFLEFQQHLDTKATPIIIKGVMDDWPAVADIKHGWNNPSYLLKATLGGRRLVPVELGKSYTDHGWSQQIMTFAEYIKTHLLQPKQEKIGYLAQHDLFAQIPSLSADTNIPDYCYTNPPPCASSSSTLKVDALDEPMRNAWLGPAGTISPLHTDPYHNILCQLVGYKYIRLYAPSETASLYPRGIDDTGVNMENTSNLDIALARKLYSPEVHDSQNEADIKDFETQFPLFKTAQCVEGVLGPGESLYIPVGWWHFVESLSTSFSMSFWWN